MGGSWSTRCSSISALPRRPTLADGDTLEIAGDFFTIRGEPRRDTERLIWHAEARAL